MARHKKNQHQPKQELTGTERLGLRVAEMIGSPKAQLERRAVIHRLDTDTDEAWDAILELLQETDGLKLEHHEDGTVTVSWDAATDERIEDEEGDLMRVEVNEAVTVAPF
ncbi:DUF1654 domain-containing protein [Pseudomonas sp. NY15364]|uniref:DUF1654 domain-containing protein n=1 Tax=Pseudomonas sp. NY15364 TaxID=3400353 RepID=UPI003A8C062C